jgi:hypothetical protein
VRGGRLRVEVFDHDTGSGHDFLGQVCWRHLYHRQAVWYHHTAAYYRYITATALV